ncbi:MAG: hypothetical protein ACK5N8_07625, partial [Alphaproteobacteria bacterium]
MNRIFLPCIVLSCATLFFPADAFSQTASGDDGLYQFSVANSSDYDFTSFELDDNGNYVLKYYKIEFNPEALSSSVNISWNQVSSTGAQTHSVKISKNRTQYFQYIYSTIDATRTLYSTQQNALNGDVVADFIVISSNYNNAETNMQNVTSITGDFVGNTVSGSLNSGGAIFNAVGDIQTIAGNFIANSSIGYGNGRYGGAIYNIYSGTIQNINANFIGNSSIENYNTGAYGGAIDNSFGTIEDITGDFVGNYSSGVYGNGGAIYNYYGEISDIIGDFKENYAYGTDATTGGAISNGLGTISNITGNFIGNYVSVASPVSADRFVYAKGGAIYNNHDGTISNITGDFIGNYAKFVTSDGNTAIAYGGAIYNNGIIVLKTTESKRSILFENNKVITQAGNSAEIAKLNSINFGYNTAVINIDTIANSYVNIRDPMTSYDYYGNSSHDGQINMSGAGSMYLWGDNSEYGGEINIYEGDFAALFEEAQDYINDPLGQRTNFSLANATINFADGTTFRPMVTDNKIANLGGTVITG